MKRIAVNAMVVLATVSVSACATVSPADYPPDHPANADAPAASPVAAPRTLAKYKHAAGSGQRVPADEPDPGKAGPGPASQQNKDANHDHQ